MYNNGIMMIKMYLYLVCDNICYFELFFFILLLFFYLLKNEMRFNDVFVICDNMFIILKE